MGLSENISKLMDQAISTGVFPGAVVLVAEAGEILWEGAFGVTSIESGTEVSVNTIYDLASLTKPLATAPVIMTLIQENSLSLDTPVSSILPGFQRGEKRWITIRHLLCHTSGLPDHKPYFETLKLYPEHERIACLRKLLTDEKLINPVGDAVVYSDLGYMVLAWLIEEVEGQAIDRVVEKRVYGPLGINDLYYIRELHHRTANIASTEDCPWRKKVLKGEVHDDNAWICGKVNGHAGLFGTAHGVYEMLAGLLCSYHGTSAERVFDRRVVREFLTEHKHLRRTPGFDMPSPEGSSSGVYFSENSVGHLGFTGTSFWMDVDRQLIVVLLTNRVNPSRENMHIKRFRPLFHNTVMENLLNSDV